MSKKPWNIIFLDIDGVLATRKTHYQYFQEECVSELNRVIKETGARIVISSSWRCHWKFDDLKAVFTDSGIDGNLIVSVTPDLINASRGAEISKWLRDNKDIWIRRIAIIDDECYDIEQYKELKSRLVEVETEKGFTAEDADKAISILNSERRWACSSIG